MIKTVRKVRQPYQLWFWSTYGKPLTPCVKGVYRKRPREFPVVFLGPSPPLPCKEVRAQVASHTGPNIWGVGACCSHIHSPWLGDKKLTQAQGCRTPPPAYVDWRAGTTTLCQSWLYPPSQGYWPWTRIIIRQQKRQKGQWRNYSAHRIPVRLSLRRNWVPPPSLPQDMCLPPPRTQVGGGGGETLACGGGGGTQFRRRDRSSGTPFII
jgi:hypothetical protein